MCISYINIKFIFHWPHFMEEISMEEGYYYKINLFIVHNETVIGIQNTNTHMNVQKLSPNINYTSLYYQSQVIIKINGEIIV